MDNNLDQIPGAGWVLDDQGRPVLDLGGEVLHGNTLLSGLLHNYNLPIAQDISNTNQEQGPQISDVPALAKEDLIRGGQYIKDHPGEILAGLASPELGVPGSIAAGLGGYLFDSMHPFSHQLPDYKTKSAKEYIANGLLSGALNAVPASKGSDELTDAGLRSAMTDAPDFASREVVPEAENSMKTGYVGPRNSFEGWPAPPNINTAPKPLYIPSEDVGGVPGYRVYNYDAIPGAAENEKRLADQGITRFIPNSQSDNPIFDDPNQLVGNFPYSSDITTPEGKAYAQMQAQRSPLLADRVYKGYNPLSHDPHLAVPTFPNRFDMNRGNEDDIQYILDQETNTWHKPVWASSSAAQGQSYGTPIIGSTKYADAIRAAVQSGQINKSNLPNKFNSVEDVLNFADNYDRYNRGDIGAPSDQQVVFNNILQNDPRLIEPYRTFIPSSSNPLFEDMGGKSYKWHDIQGWDLLKAQKAGHDSYIYGNQVDPGKAITEQQWAATRPELYKQAVQPADVHVIFDPRRLHYPSSYTWDMSDMRPLAAAPIAAGLGSYLLKQKEKKEEQ